MRFFSTALALSAIPAAVLAANQTVTVGDGGMLMFNPQTITAAVGDTINFEFRAKNHSVTQSTFAEPCTKAMFNGTPGVTAGFLAVPQDNTLQPGQFPTWSITVKDPKPLWFFCGQKMPVNHCQMGMVFSINPTADKSHDQFVAAAKASTADNSTGSATPTEGAAPSGTASSDGASSSAGAASSDGAASSTAAASSAGDASAAAASATGSGVAAAAEGTSAASSSGTNAADSSTPSTSGASKTMFTRGAAGLFTVVTVVSAVLL